MNELVLFVLALLPGFVLLYLILYMDRAEREPMGLVVLAVVVGAASANPVIVMEQLLGLLPIYEGGQVWKAISTAFIQVAWVEELGKLGFVLAIVWKNKNFNEENDGIVYIGAGALGFAMLENVFYVFQHGFGTGILRAFTAVPLHCFTGILMGYYVGHARMAPDRERRRSYLWKGFLLAVLIHGIYDALLMSQTPAAILVVPLLVGTIVFGIWFMRKGRALSRARVAAASGEEDEAERQVRTFFAANPRNQLWKIIVSRSLFIFIGIMWIALMVAFEKNMMETAEELGMIIMGGIFISIIPLIIAILLEVSYRRRKLRYREMKDTGKIPAIPQMTYVSPAVAHSVWPPGQLWRAIVGRTALVLTGVFWSLFLLAYIADSSDLRYTGFAFLIAVLLLTFPFFIVGVLTEHSYRLRKRRFMRLVKALPVHEITSEKLALSPPGQFWKIVISRPILSICGWFWVLIVWGVLSGMELPETLGVIELFVGMVIVTFTPIVAGIVLEVTYQLKKREFWDARNRESLIPSTAHDPKKAADSDEELSEYARQLKAKRDREGY